MLTNRKEGNISKINMEKKYPAVEPIQFYFDVSIFNLSAKQSNE